MLFTIIIQKFYVSVYCICRTYSNTKIINFAKIFVGGGGMRKFLLCLVILGFLLFGVNLGYSQAKSSSQAKVSQAKKVKQTKKEKALIYYPVPYIPVLKDLRYIADKSAILHTENIVTGMLVFKANYNAKALLEFYKTQMRNNGWREVGSFTSTITFIAYKRPEGNAFISITESAFSTELRIVIILKNIKNTF